ncbi:MAG: cupredoxin domain-containing protein [Thermomicrobiales bacterium]
MKRASVLVVLFVLLAVPIIARAQYDDNYPNGGTGGNQGGGMNVGGGMDDSHGGMMGGDDMHSGDMHSGESEDVAIVDFSFQPTTMFVHSGDTVDWYNEGGVAHTVDADGGAFESGTINPGGEFSVTFDQRGVYAYHCDIHPNMHGTVVVN